MVLEGPEQVMVLGVQSGLGAALGVPPTRPRPNRGPTNCRLQLTHDVTRPKRITTPTNCVHRTADIGAARTAGSPAPLGRHGRVRTAPKRRIDVHVATGNHVLPSPVAKMWEVKPRWRPLPDRDGRMYASHALAPVARAVARPLIQAL
jgi:hypothetical protein